MASLSTDSKTKARKIQFMHEGSRRTVYLGAVPVKAAESFKLRLESLLASLGMNAPVDSATALWLAEMDDDHHGKLARLGLVEPREDSEAVTVAGLLCRFFEAYDGKESTLTRMRQAEQRLLEFFEADADADDVTADDADAWRASMIERGYAEATVARTVKYARQFWAWAIGRDLVGENPFSKTRTGSQSNAERTVFVDRPTIARVMDAAPSAQWRALIALCRFGGLRIGEALRLRWADIDWDAKRMQVRSTKTEHHEGGGSRAVPVFPELYPLLLEAFEASDGSERVLSDFRTDYNPGPQLGRIVDRAGLERWPRMLHNLRGSRQNELILQFPITTACAWIGNSRAVAAGHYYQTNDADWQRAIGGTIVGDAKYDARLTQNTTQHSPASDRTDSQSSMQDVGDKCSRRLDAESCEVTQLARMGPVGLEQGQDSPGNTHIPRPCSAESDAVCRDERLRQLVEAWDRLPESTKSEVITLVDATTSVDK